jgi:hypothetical protein
MTDGRESYVGWVHVLHRNDVDSVKGYYQRMVAAQRSPPDAGLYQRIVRYAALVTSLSQRIAKERASNLSPYCRQSGRNLRVKCSAKQYHVGRQVKPYQ